MLGDCEFMLGLGCFYVIYWRVILLVIFIFNDFVFEVFNIIVLIFLYFGICINYYD